MKTTIKTAVSATPIAAATTIAIMTISHANAQMLPNAFGEIAGQIAGQMIPQVSQVSPYAPPMYGQPYAAPYAAAPQQPSYTYSQQFALSPSGKPCPYLSSCTDQEADYVWQQNHPGGQAPTFNNPYAAYQALRAQYAWTHCNTEEQCTYRAIQQRIAAALPQASGTPEQQAVQVCGPRPESDPNNARPYAQCHDDVLIRVSIAREGQQCGAEPHDGPVYGLLPQRSAGAPGTVMIGGIVPAALMQDGSAAWKAWKQCADRLHEQVWGPGQGAHSLYTRFQ
jgi:hypothetical protein